jgi:hypothetical protein
VIFVDPEKVMLLTMRSAVMLKGVVPLKVSGADGA